MSKLTHIALGAILFATPTLGLTSQVRAQSSAAETLESFWDMLFGGNSKRGPTNGGGGTEGGNGAGSGSNPSAASPAPEPVSMSLLGIGGLGIGLALRRRRRLQDADEDAAQQAVS